MDLIDYECLDLLRKRIHQVILLVWAEIILWEPTLILMMRIDMNHCKGRFTLWPKVERPSISINRIARNQEFGLSTLHTQAKGRRNLKCLLLQEGDGLSKEVSVRQEWRPKLWSRGHQVFFLWKKKSIIDKILVVILEGLFWVRNKMACSF
jgi:hypothetical protein